jgi:hypothetical protein
LNLNEFNCYFFIRLEEKVNLIEKKYTDRLEQLESKFEENKGIWHGVLEKELLKEKLNNESAQKTIQQLNSAFEKEKKQLQQKIHQLEGTIAKQRAQMVAISFIIT